MATLARAFLLAIRYITFAWIVVVIRLVSRYCRTLRKRKHEKRTKGRRERRETPADCVEIRSVAYARPDPLIYSQHYLAAQGLAVTWDNPDIQLYLNGAPVSSYSLQPGTRYDVVATLWNSSADAPVVAMEVQFSYLDFGIGTVSVPIGSTYANVGVVGGSDNPSSATMQWTTPNRPGHYCLQVRLIWSDDANPNNNLGQENTQVVSPASPAAFRFRLRNDGERRTTYSFKVDGYAIPKLPDCNDKEASDPKQLLVRHGAASHPAWPGWAVSLNPDAPTLDPGEETDVDGLLAPPANGFAGRLPFNVRAIDGDGRMVGGVTIYVEKR